MASIQEIWLLDRQGLILFNLRLDDRPIRQDLLGGFLAAITQLGQELDKSNASSVLIGPTRLSVIQVEEGNLIIAARSKAKEKEKKVNEILARVKRRLVDYLTGRGPRTATRDKINTIGTAFQFDEGLTQIFLDMEE